MKQTQLALVALAVVALAGCGSGNVREVAGSGLGAVAGGVLGHQFGKGSGRELATAAGAVLGALAGGAVGRHLDAAAHEAADRARLQALDTAVPGGAGIKWAAPATSTTPASGEVAVLREGKTAAGSVCRETRITATIGGETESIIGMACRDAGGTWRAVGS